MEILKSVAWRCRCGAAMRLRPGLKNFVTSPIGTPDRARTYNLRLRRPTLYPVELRAHGRRLGTITRRDGGRAWPFLPGAYPPA